MAGVGRDARDSVRHCGCGVVGFATMNWLMDGLQGLGFWNVLLLLLVAIDLAADITEG